MNQLILKGMYACLIDRSNEWWDPMSGYENQARDAWRAIAYHLAKVDSNSEPIEKARKILENLK